MRSEDQEFTEFLASLPWSYTTKMVDLMRRAWDKRAALSQQVDTCPACNGPDYSDGCEKEGFPGGCERMGCCGHAEPASAQDELPAGGVTIEKDIFGTVHIKMGDFDYIQIQYQYPYTDNASQNVLAKRIAELLTRPAQTEQPVAYLDLGIGGYMDLGTDLTDEQLEGLPWGRHMLGIIRTYGADGYVPAAPIAQTAPQPEQSGWISVEERMPDPEQHDRVLIFTDGYDFAGEQVFDVKAEHLNENSFGDPDDQPEPYNKATHWMPLPAAPAALAAQGGAE